MTNIRKLVAQSLEKGITLMPSLKFDAPATPECDALVAELAANKNEVIRYLVGPLGIDSAQYRPIDDWRFEWLHEFGKLCLYWRDATDGDAKSGLRELLNETPKNLPEWFFFAETVGITLAELRRVEKLPPLPNFED